MAVVRGRIESAPVVLASATPSIETPRQRRARALPPRAPAGALRRAALPAHPRHRPKREAMPRGPLALAAAWSAPCDETLDRGEQALLFLNRRGYAPLTLCRACGHRYECPNCSAWLVEHRFRRALVCHHCGHVERTPEACAALRQRRLAGRLRARRRADRRGGRRALSRTSARIVLSSDFPGGTERLRHGARGDRRGRVRHRHRHPARRQGPQLPAPDPGRRGRRRSRPRPPAIPRAAERTFQLLQQVTGRAGRGDKPGRALVQTYQPDHPVIAALVSGRRRALLPRGDAGRARRRACRPSAGSPRSSSRRPSGRGARKSCRAPLRRRRPDAGSRVLGPAEAPLALIRGPLPLPPARSRPSGRSTCRPICAPGWPRAVPQTQRGNVPRRPRSMSTRRASSRCGVDRPAAGQGRGGGRPHARVRFRAIRDPRAVAPAAKTIEASCEPGRVYSAVAALRANSRGLASRSLRRRAVDHRSHASPPGRSSRQLRHRGVGHGNLTGRSRAESRGPLAGTAVQAPARETRFARVAGSPYACQARFAAPRCGLEDLTRLIHRLPVPVRRPEARNPEA